MGRAGRGSSSRRRSDQGPVPRPRPSTGFASATRCGGSRSPLGSSGPGAGIPNRPENCWPANPRSRHRAVPGPARSRFRRPVGRRPAACVGAGHRRPQPLPAPGFQRTGPGCGCRSDRPGPDPKTDPPATRRLQDMVSPIRNAGGAQPCLDGIFKGRPGVEQHHLRVGEPRLQRVRDRQGPRIGIPLAVLRINKSLRDHAVSDCGSEDCRSIPAGGPRIRGPLDERDPRTWAARGSGHGRASCARTSPDVRGPAHRDGVAGAQPSTATGTETAAASRLAMARKMPIIQRIRRLSSSAKPCVRSRRVANRDQSGRWAATASSEQTRTRTR